MLPLSSRYIIAIGASAGGMEEIHRFFDNTPLDSVSYVIVQHLSPDFKSRMVELLNKHSKLKVTEATQNMHVEPNQVYFIPNHQTMTISEGRLQLKEKVKTRTPYLTVNTFFNSLAAERGNKAIGIVLSGNGDDGSEGVKAIKEAGGMIIASNPEKSEYNSMPASAIATGKVDFILEPELMPRVITTYLKDKEKELQQAQETMPLENEEKIMAAIVGLIKDNLPLDFSDYKPNTILRRIKRRATFYNYATLQNYFNFLKTNTEEVKALAYDFLIGVTAFFRDKEAFDFVESHVVPEIIKQADAANEEIKIWVAGCSTGEEAYSLAIIFKEQLEKQDKKISVKVFATDIDTAALATAGKGIFGDNITKDVTPQRIQRFFVQEKNQYKIASEIRKMLIFSQHDLAKNPPYCNMNLISCRNLLIYMTPVLQKKIYLMLHFGLKKNGYLFLGPSENAYPPTESLISINDKWKIYKSLEAKRLPIFDMFSMPTSFNPKVASSLQSFTDDYDNKKNSLHEMLNEAISDDFGSALFCIDENKQVVKAYGHTTKFLLQKNFNQNLADLLPAPLDIAFNKARREALHSNEKVAVGGININNNDQSLTVHLQLKALPVKKEGQRLMYVLLSEEHATRQLQPDAQIFNEKEYSSQYITNLEEELRETKEKLQTANDNLDASLENLQSFNEEILSANEEMQSTNEEMQSINEELQTINSDYKLKNKELIEINDDLNNYFRSNQNGQLFVNPDLMLMKFSPGTVKHINLRDTDIGRPLSNISTNLKFENIENDIKEVIANGSVISKEVEATNGLWYLIMTMPYVRATDNKTDGAIITFNDITELKKIQRDLAKTNKNLVRVNGDLDNFVLAASHDLLGPLNNIELCISMLGNSSETVSDEEKKEYLSMIKVAVKKFKAQVKEMAEIGKIESQMKNIEPVDLNDIINDVKQSISDKINSSKAMITTELNIEKISFSKKNLRSIIYNLISNAIKYKSPEREPVIIINTTKTDEYVHLSVKDNGFGIAKDKIEKIFSLYSRLQTDIEGQGIGLYLTKKIVDAEGGYIRVESELREGSTFNVYFKAEKEDAIVALN